MFDLKEFPTSLQKFYHDNNDLRPHLEPQPNKDSQWIYQQSDIPWLKLNIDTPHEEMYREAKSWIDEMVPQNYKELFDNPVLDGEFPNQKGWNTICVHGIGPKHFDRGYMYGYGHEDEVPYIWTEVADQCPITKEYLQSLPYEKLYRARFTMLAPGGYAAPHIGRKKAASHSRKINVALNHPKGFHFHLEGQGPIPWEPGRAHLIAADDFYHAVFNQSDEVRIHLITMGKPDFKRLEPLIQESYYSDDPFGYKNWEA
ncbi:MAG: aspartyl/asparaginyl beta-hydroxylase domain-containing protein [Bdellovibrionales bacterium]|nr:aspartyl/asparaginyl beta-hydroxylase domain-containing protein [Bdellovibrionales bacterium]